MARYGPAPKSTVIKELEGTYRADRAARNEPKPRVVHPSCPAWLTGKARWEYQRVAKLLATLRVMTEADRTALAAYAYEYGEWREAAAKSKGDRATMMSDKGNEYMSPWVGIANMHFKNMIGLMAQFGLTPSSRTRIEAQPTDEAETTLAEKLFESVGL